MNKTAIRNFAVNARKKLIASVIESMGMLAISNNEIREPQTSGVDFQVFKTFAGTEVTLYRQEQTERNNLIKRIKEKGFDNVVEEVAYTWFNRIIAIRFMEVNDYLPSRIRVLSSETEGKIEPDIISEALNIDLDLTDKEKEEIIVLRAKNDDKSMDKLFQMLFIKQCNKLGELLPELFEKTADYTELLLNISYIKEDGVIRELIETVPEEDFLEAVEIIGWMYQYYNDERKNEVINIYKGTVKKEDIPAATQLFTTDWVVRYMVDNSLGRYWIERNPNSKLKEKLEFYIEPKDSATKYIDEKVELKDLTFIDIITTKTIQFNYPILSAS